MRTRSLLLAALTVAIAFSGCLNDGDDSTPDTPTEPVITKGASLGSVAFDASGSFAASVEVVDPSLENGCGGLGIDQATHIWDIPATDDDGVPATVKSATINLHETSQTSLDLDLFVYDDAGNLLGQSTNSDVTGDDGDVVLLSSRPAGRILIDVRGCLGVAADYHVAGLADLVAAGDVFEAPRGPVEVSQRNGMWYATRTIQYDLDVAANVGDADVSTGAGFVSFTGGGSGYHLTAELTGMGDTEQEARDRLDAIHVDHDVTDGNRLNVDVHARTDSGNWNRQQADLVFRVQDLDWGLLEARTSAGAVELENLHGKTLLGATNAGSVAGRDLTADDIALDSDAGAVDLRASTGTDLTLVSSAGSVTADVGAPVASGKWILRSNAGAVVLRLDETSGNGYDVDASTDAGGVDLDFRDMETTTSDCEYASCHKHATTNGYDGRSIQTVVDLDTNAGAIDASS